MVLPPGNTGYLAITSREEEPLPELDEYEINGVRAAGSMHTRRTTGVRFVKRPIADTSVYLGHPPQGLPCSALPWILLQSSQVAPDTRQHSSDLHTHHLGGLHCQLCAATQVAV